jgi:hypothetical protein
MNFQNQFDKTYKELFGHTHFGRPYKLKLISKVEEELVKRFIHGFLHLDAPIFFPENRWNLTQWLAGELCSDLQTIGKSESCCVEFYKPTQFLEVNPEMLFTLAMVLREQLSEKMNLEKCSKSGFPDWFKLQDYERFFRNLNYLQSKPARVKSILCGRKLDVDYVQNQKMALDLVKGKTTDEKIDKIIKIVHNRAPGERKKKDQSRAAVKRQIVKLFDTVKEIFEEEWHAKNPLSRKETLDQAWIKFRMTRDKAGKAVEYWALMGTISFRKDRSISVSTEIEKAFFSKPYRIIRKAMVRLKMISCEDATYCPGVKCQDWSISLMMPKEMKMTPVIQVNDIERKFFEMADPHERKAYAEKISPYAYRFLLAKEKALDGLDEVKALKKKIKSKSFVIRQYGQENGKGFVKNQWSTVNHARLRAHKLTEEIKEFFDVFSDKSTYDWPIIARGNGEEYTWRKVS